MAVALWWATLSVVDRGLAAGLDAVERARAEAYERPADRARSLLGAALLRTAVADHLGVAPHEVVVDRRCPDCGAQHGAPRILGPGTDHSWVSVSHSGLLAVVAVSGAGPVGVDVQRIADLADPADAPGWVRREALLKAGCPQDGTGCHCHELATPLAGYAAALATYGEAVHEPAVQHWPDQRSPTSPSRAKV